MRGDEDDEDDDYDDFYDDDEEEENFLDRLDARGRQLRFARVQHRNGQHQHPFPHAQTRRAGSRTESNPPQGRARAGLQSERPEAHRARQVHRLNKNRRKEKSGQKEGGCCRRGNGNQGFERRKSTLT